MKEVHRQLFQKHGHNHPKNFIFSKAQNQNIYFLWIWARNICFGLSIPSIFYASMSKLGALAQNIFYNNWVLTSSWEESFVGGGHRSFIYSTITINLQFRCANQHSNRAQWPIIPSILVLTSFVILIMFYSKFSLLRPLHNKIFQNSHWFLN